MKFGEYEVDMDQMIEIEKEALKQAEELEAVAKMLREQVLESYKNRAYIARIVI